MIRLFCASSVVIRIRLPAMADIKMRHFLTAAGGQSGNNRFPEAVEFRQAPSSTACALLLLLRPIPSTTFGGKTCRFATPSWLPPSLPPSSPVATSATKHLPRRPPLPRLHPNQHRPPARRLRQPPRHRLIRVPPPPRPHRPRPRLRIPRLAALPVRRSKRAFRALRALHITRANKNGKSRPITLQWEQHCIRRDGQPLRRFLWWSGARQSGIVRKKSDPRAQSSRTFFCGPQSYRWLNCSFNLPLDRELARSLLAAGFFSSCARQARLSWTAAFAAQGGFVTSRKISISADGIWGRLTAIIDVLARLARLPISLVRASQSRRNETCFCLVEYQPVPGCCPQ